MEDSLREMEVDLQKMPLGQLKPSQITAGYDVLTNIQKVLEAQDLTDGARKQRLR